MTFVRRPGSAWQLRTRSLALGQRTLIMGVLNVTPDSFSDGGLYLGPHAATEQAFALLDQGADIVDIGGESTRPGAQPLSAHEEQDRILPVIEAVMRERSDALFSVDTWKAATATAAAAAGAEIVNDVSAFQWDAGMAAACARLQCGVVLMHTRGRPGDWRMQPRLPNEDVVPLVKTGLAQALARAIAAGLAPGRIVLDPGYGFGKMHDENYPLLAHLDELLSLGCPLLAGVSRKSFLGHSVAAAIGAADVPVHARGNATLAATTAAILAGASIVRVHDVRPALEAAAIADAILAAL
ncbi:MAG TPA: dihydropteroate synthase [Acidobacteriaceae bacterium]|jgi:dihydropteroate synthase|nr:dihydropteroate synthase [Acidobacteriaceae bacterium]